MLRVTLALALLLATQLSHAVVLLADDFDDGDVSDWSVEYFGDFTNLSAVADKGIEATTFDSVSSPYALRTYFVSEVGNSQDNCPADPARCGVRAVIDFNVAVAGNYVLDVFARSRDCGGCTMLYEIFNGSNVLTSVNALTFEQRTFNLTLAAGVNTLKLGLSTDAAFSGNFQALFDDVCIATGGRDECYPQPVPESATLGVALLGFIGITLASLARTGQRRGGQRAKAGDRSVNA